MAMLTAEVTQIKNDQSRNGGFSPSQWVLGKRPNRLGGQFDEEHWSDLGIISEKLDAGTAFALQEEMRLKIEKHSCRSIGANEFRELFFVRLPHFRVNIAWETSCVFGEWQIQRTPNRDGQRPRES